MGIEGENNQTEEFEFKSYTTTVTEKEHLDNSSSIFICSSCGNERIVHDDHFCSNCGLKIEWSNKEDVSLVDIIKTAKDYIANKNAIDSIFFSEEYSKDEQKAFVQGALWMKNNKKNKESDHS